MRAITRDTVAKDVHDKWIVMHPNIPTPFPPAEECTVEIVSKIIKDYFGVVHPFWIQMPSCGECNASNLEWVVEVGEKPDHDSATAYLCKDCVVRLFHLVQE